MRRFSARLIAFAACLAVLAHVGAADVSDDELKVVVEQDGKILVRGSEAVEKATAKTKKNVERNASNGAKSSALILAAIANERITGKNADADAKSAAIRDTAIQLYKDASEKNFKGVADAAKALAAPKPAAGAKKIADISKSFAEASPKDVMHNFLKVDQYGTNAEADIIANSKKPVAKPETTIAIAHRVIAMYELNKSITNAEGAKKKEWDDFNEKMLKAGNALLEAGRAKKTGADLSKAYLAVDSTCKLCHDKFKNE